MIKKLRIKNFKAFRDETEIDFSSLTLFSGLNSSGKSSAHQAILVISQSLHYWYEDCLGNKLPTLRLNGSQVKLGNMDDIVNNHEDKSISFYFEFDDEVTVSLTFSFESEPGNIGYKEWVDNTIFLSRLSFTSNSGCYSVEAKKTTWKIKAYNCLMFEDYDVHQAIINSVKQLKKALLNKHTLDDIDTDIEANPFNSSVSFHEATKVDISFCQLHTLSIPIHELTATFSDETKLEIEDRDLIDLISNRLDTNEISLASSLPTKAFGFLPARINPIYIPQFRGEPRRIYIEENDGNPLHNYSRNKNKNINYRFDFSNRTTKKGSLEEALHYWLVEHFQITSDINVVESLSGMVNEIFLTDGTKKISINNVGFGISQFLPYIYTILSTKQCSLFIIDEPESHLHPSMQSKLADFFVEMIMTGRHIFIETHSEYLIDKLIYHILKYPYTSDYINMLWAKRVDTRSSIEPIHFDDLGYLINPPDNFLCEKSNLVDEINAIRLSRLIG